MKKKIGLICICALLLTGCGKAKLKNGEEAVVKFKNGEMISVDELYKNMKDDFALDSLITMIDTYIYETEFKDFVETAKSYAENYVKMMEQNYGGAESFRQALQGAGYSTVEAYEKSMYVTYLQNHAIEEYAKIKVTDKDIETYYNDKAQGDVEISHILITDKTTNTMTEEESKKAKEDAKKQAEEILAELKKSKDLAKDFEAKAKEKSEDESNKNEGGKLGKVTYGDLDENYDEVLDAAYKIKDGEMYGKVVESDLGYHIIYRTKSYEKEPLKDLKEEIRGILAKDLMENTKDISVQAFQYYRKEYGLDIKDSELNKQYDDYMKRLIASFNQTTDTNTNQ